MSYEQVWFSILVAAFALGCGLAIWARHLREKKRLEVREMIHDERMAALENGTALAELPADLARGDDTGAGGESSVNGRWVQRSALAAGFILVLGGLGVMVALSALPSTPELRDLTRMAPVGVIPILVGVGLLLYAWVDRRLFREEPS